MTDLRQAAQQALEALENIDRAMPFPVGKKVITALREALAQPAQEPVAHTVIAGALFDFMGYLTSCKERIVLSASDDAAPAADAIRDFAKKRGLSLDDAQVREWIDALAQPEQEPTPWRDMVVATLVREGVNKHKARELADHFAAQPKQEPWRESASDYERGVIDGRQMQAQSSVDKAVKAMTQRPWQGMTEKDWEYVKDSKGTSLDTFDQGAAWAANQLRRRNA